MMVGGRWWGGGVQRRVSLAFPQNQKVERALLFPTVYDEHNNRKGFISVAWFYFEYTV